jgi:hypothetical protein
MISRFSKHRAHKRKKEEKIGFFKRLFGGGDPVKRRAIRALKRELSTSKIDLYKIKYDLISTPIARILFEIYKLTSPLKQLIPYDDSNKKFPPSFEESFVLYFHETEAHDIYTKLNEDYIKKLIEKHGYQKTTAHIDKLLNEYLDGFDKETTERINSIYGNFIGFVRFVNFDFFPVLREFDPNLEEANFSKKPSFAPAEGSFLRNDLFKLHKILFSFDPDEKLNEGMQVFATIKGVEPISKGNFNKLRNLIVSLQRNHYISLIIRAIDKKVDPLPIDRPPITGIFNSFSIRRKGEITSILNSIKNKIKEESVTSIESQLFKGGVNEKLKNYNDSKNDQFKNLDLPIFEYVKPLTYLKVFITDKYKPLITKVINELIVGGIFINRGLLNNLSNNYYALNGHLHNIAKLENDLDSEGMSGKVINRRLYAIKKDRTARKILEQTINDANVNARYLINDGLLNFKEMAYCIKNVLEDYKRKTPSVVSNIKKIRLNHNRQFIDDLVKSYKDIYLFLKLLSNYVSIKVSRPGADKQKKTMSEQVTD